MNRTLPTSPSGGLSRITEAVLSITRALAPHYIWELVRLLDDEKCLGMDAHPEIGAHFPNSVARDQVERFMACVAGFSTKEVAVALACAVSVAEEIRQEQSIEIVWTGPETPAISLRRSAAVLLELIDGAKSDVILLSFAAFRIADLIFSLQQAAARGVSIHLMLESGRESSGRISTSADLAFERLRGHARFYVWPAAQRPPGAVMHAKCVVADAERALITSANLTEHAIDINMELGLLICGGDVPQRLKGHLLGLIDQGIFLDVN